MLLIGRCMLLLLVPLYTATAAAPGAGAGAITAHGALAAGAELVPLLQEKNTYIPWIILNDCLKILAIFQPTINSIESGENHQHFV